MRSLDISFLLIRLNRTCLTSSNYTSVRVANLKCTLPHFVGCYIRKKRNFLFCRLLYYLFPISISLCMLLFFLLVSFRPSLRSPLFLSQFYHDAALFLPLLHLAHFKWIDPIFRWSYHLWFLFSLSSQLHQFFFFIVAVFVSPNTFIVAMNEVLLEISIKPIHISQRQKKKLKSIKRRKFFDDFFFFLPLSIFGSVRFNRKKMQFLLLLVLVGILVCQSSKTF